MPENPNLLTNPDLDDYPDRMCCAWIEHLWANGYKFPYRMTKVMPGKGEGAKVHYSIAFYQQDARTHQPITGRDVLLLDLPYCPFCGAKING